MNMYKKILIVAAMGIVSVLCMCCGKKEKGVVNQEKVPTTTSVIINDTEYSLKDMEKKDGSRIEYSLEVPGTEEGKIEVILPKISNVNTWWFGESSEVDLLSYSKYRMNPDMDEVREGESDEVQRFELYCEREVIFKWSNVNEAEKAFADRDAQYTLTIKITK